jgi:hypothetical protein
LPCQGRSGQGCWQRARSWCRRTPGLPASSSRGAENNGARQQRGRPRRWWWITPAHLALAQPGVTVAALISPARTGRGKCHVNIPPSPAAPPQQPALSFTTLCRPKISQAQNGFPRLTRPVFRRRLPVQHIAWTASTTNMDLLPTSCSPLPYCSTPIGHTTFSHNLLSII